MPYQMTAGEELVYRDLTAIIDSVKKWTMFTSWDTIASDRQRIADVRASAGKNLSDPKKIDAVTRLQALWAGYKTKKDEGWKSLQGYYSRGLTRVRDIISYDVPTVIKIIKEETGVTPPVGAPVAVAAPIIVQPEKKILGMSPGVALASGVGLLTVGYIVYKGIVK